MPALLIAIGALAGSAGGLVSVILKALRHTVAERKMKQVLQEDDTDNAAKLESLTKNLQNDPDPTSLYEAQRILTSLTGTLSNSDKSDILSVLDRGSDRSKANYIAKLVEDAGTGTDGLAERDQENPPAQK
jgi:hypothetical protein